MKDEIIKKLLEKFYGENAGQVAEDIEKCDLFFAAHPGPKPDDAVIDSIKSKIQSRLVHQSSRWTNTISLKAAAAALLAIIAFAGIRTFVNKGTPSLPAVPQGLSYFWGDDAVAAEDPRLTIMVDELDDIENSIVLIERDEPETESEIAVDDIELEIIELSNGFWRG